jgi:hypothetical protein
MGTEPHYIGKRMRELLSGAAIGIIPYPPKDDYFGTIDEHRGSRRRFLFLGYEQEKSSKLLWSLYGFSPQYGTYDYGFMLAKVQQYNEICKDGKISDSDYVKYKTLIAEAGQIPTRTNGMLWGFTAENDTEIANLELNAKSKMKINPKLAKRTDVIELIETTCGADQLMKSNQLNIWGDYKFLWHDFGFFVDYRFLCGLGIEKTTSYYAMGIYAKNTPTLNTSRSLAQN